MTLLDPLLAEIRACRHCAEHLPLGPRPVVVATATARILIVGQAPGTKVHESGIPWNDRSGDTLRGWMAVDREVFYDPARIAIMPMGFCYPGRLDKGGDAPPRPECAPLWHDRLLEHLPNIELVILAGMYAQARYLGDRRQPTLTETVAAWRDYGPRDFPLPHPSWRSANLIKKNPWFEAELLPELRARVAVLAAQPSASS
ncbi:MAG: uracil-DNA glycosylase family protein [Alphaproteobacteria bacterium]|nr:uracil-DNA glycosylase family protein [Alphaproteobacteria bacterium]